MPWIGRSTCASASALSFDAQPAQLERLVRRICRPEGGSADWFTIPQGVDVGVGVGNGVAVGTAVGTNSVSLANAGSIVGTGRM